MERSFIKVSILCLFAAISLGSEVSAQTTVVGGIKYQRVNNGATATCLGPDDKSTFTSQGLTIPAQVQIDGVDCNVVTIGQSAFDGCVNITGELKLPETVKDLSFYAFQNCTGLTGTIDLSNLGARGVSNYCFKGCTGLEKLILGEVTEAIGIEAFAGCYGLKGELDLSHITETIGNSAFKDCTGFTSIKMSPSTKQIYPYAFQNCTGLTGDLTIPQMLSSLGDYAFDGCTSLNGTLKFTGETKIGKFAFRKCAFTGPLDLSEVTSIDDNAFQNCSGFTGDLVFSSSLVSLGSYAFDGCSGFDGKLDLSNLQEGFRSSGVKNTLGKYVFRKCSNLKGDIVIPDFITEIDLGTFDGCSGFDGELKLNEKLELINALAFRNCSGLKGTLTFPASFTMFGDIAYDFYAIHAFNGCKGFTGIEFKSGKVNAMPESVFQNCSGLTGTLVLPEITETNSIDKNAFAGCSNITDVTFDDNVTTICTEAFSGCTSLESLKLPASITTLEDKAFYGCSALNIEFVIPETVESIGEECFANSGLAGVVIPDYSNLTVAEGAFSNMSDCKWIISLADTPSDKIAFDAQTPLYVHSQVVDAYKKAVSGNDNIYPILTVDDIAMYVNSSAQVNYKYQPEGLSEETSAAISKLSPAFKGESINWSVTDNSDVISFDNATLNVKGLAEGSANIVANDGVNNTTATVTVTAAPEPDNKCDCGCCEAGDENASVRERIFMIPDEQKDLTSLLASIGADVEPLAIAANLEAASWTTSNEEIVNVDTDGNARAVNFGEAYVRAKDADGNTVAVITVYVCPTITVEHADGIFYTHHVIYNSRPLVTLSPSQSYLISGVTHDGTEISSSLIDNDGKYTSYKPITENSTINVSLERNTNGDQTTGTGSVVSDSDVRLYVNGHTVKVVGAQAGATVSVTTLAGSAVMIDLSPNYEFEIVENGIYIVTVDDSSFKIIVR